VTDEVTMARIGLLDALEALESHLDALVLIGAQAVWSTGRLDGARRRRRNRASWSSRAAARLEVDAEGAWH
jgi:hypothetical protein